MNAVTEPDRFPIPLLHDFAVNLHGTKIFSKLDLYSAYNQIPMFEDDIPKTAVITPFGLYQYNVMTFGLLNAGATFQRYIHKALGDLEYVFAYIDDILIASRTMEEHEKHIREVLSRLQQHGLRINADKCFLGAEEIEFLGHIINSEGSKPTPEKIKAISEFPKPKTILELRKFLGLTNFYRRVIKNAAQIQGPLNAFLKDSRKNDKRVIPWNIEAEKAFTELKNELAKQTLLAHPSETAPMRLVTDASDFGMGTVLEQKTNEGWVPLGFFSRKFTPAQKRYSTYDRELTAIQKAVEYFQHHLERGGTTVLTDHKPLIYALLQTTDKASDRQRRQISFISQYIKKIEHIAGTENVVADALSRVETITVAPEIVLSELAAAQETDEELRSIMESGSTSLKIKKMNFGSDKVTIHCDISGEDVRPFVPLEFRKKIFNIFHSPAHPSAKITSKIIRQRYVWPSIDKDITQWSKSCLECQRAKISRHTKLQPASFVPPNARFRHVHMDLIGPLPRIDGLQYCLTMMDRFTRWPEAIPISDISAQTVCRAVVYHWISRYGTPETITTDQGTQFESRLFKELLRVSGCSRIRTTPYHPAANGLIERWHRTLKGAIMCHTDKDWTRVLSTVLLGLRVNILDCGSSPAEYLYGTTLRVPGELVLTEEDQSNNEQFVSEFREHMKEIKPSPVEHHDRRKAFVSKNLKDCSHIFLRVGASRRSLQCPYTGPHKIIERISDRVIKIDFNGTHKQVSIENVKPAIHTSDETSKQASRVINQSPGILSKLANRPVEPITQRNVTEKTTNYVKVPNETIPIADEKSKKQTLTKKNNITIATKTNVNKTKEIQNNNIELKATDAACSSKTESKICEKRVRFQPAILRRGRKK